MATTRSWPWGHPAWALSPPPPWWSLLGPPLALASSLVAPLEKQGRGGILALFQGPLTVGVASQEDRCFTKWQMSVLFPGLGRRWALRRRCQLVGQREPQPHLRSLNSHRLLWASAGREASGQGPVGEQGTEPPIQNLSQPQDECLTPPSRGPWNMHLTSHGLNSHPLQSEDLKPDWRVLVEAEQRESD